MIHCPRCGATNPDDGKSCSACGQPLPAPTAGGTKCPQCGAENDSGAVFCDECGARLTTASPIPESEPTRRVPIKGLSLPKKQTGELNPSSLPDASGDIPEEVPSWLQKLLITYGLVKPEEEEEEPLSLQDRVAEPGREPEPAEKPAPLAEAEPEDWLAVLREPGEEPVPVEPEKSEEPEFADWLQALRSEGEGWEQEAEEAEETEEIAPPLAEVEVSDWLRSLREPEAKVAAEPSDATGLELEEEELPDWLRDLGKPGAEAEEIPPLVEELPLAEEEELPDWLRDLGEPGAEAGEIPSLVEEPPPAEMPEDEEEELPVVEVPPAVEFPESPVASVANEEELPEWLAELREEETIVSPVETTPAPEVPALAEPEGEEMPEWLREVRKPEGKEGEPSDPLALIMPEAAVEEPGGGEGEEEIEIPEWLQETKGMEPVLTEDVPGEEAAPPDWLTQPKVPDVTIEEGELRVPDWLQGPVPADSKVTTEDKDTAPPDWLQELGAPALPPTEIEEEPAAESPSWLEEPQPSTEAPVGEEVSPFTSEGLEELAEILELRALEGPPVLEEPLAPPEEPAAGAEEAEGLARADIPDWLLALRPHEPGEETVGEQEIAELSGPLAGIKGVLSVEPIISLPHLTRPKAVAVEAPPISGDLFAEIVAQPPVSTVAVPRRARARFVVGVQRVLIYLLLLAAVVVPILIGPIYGPADAKELQAGAESFYAFLHELPADSVVVVAFDYNPATAAELSLQAQAIVDHLMRRGVRIMAISLYPEGAALAGDVLYELAEEWGYIYGEDYIHLGYLPNQPASVRRFLDVGPAGEGQNDYRGGQPVSQSAIAQGVNDMSSVSLVVELAGDKSTLRTWVEQITARTGVPVVAGVSAATAPYAQPYLDSGQLQALLVGLPGAAEYEAQAGRKGKAIDSLGSQVAAQAVIVLLILLGNVVHLVTRGGKK